MLFIYFGVALLEQDPVKCKKSKFLTLHGAQVQKYHPKIKEQNLFVNTKTSSLKSYKNCYNILRNKKVIEC